MTAITERLFTLRVCFHMVLSSINAKITAVRNFPRNVRNWWEDLPVRIAARVVNWAFRHYEVQHAFVDNIRCTTPIGAALNQQINSEVDGIINGLSASDIDGLGREIEEGVSEFMNSHDFDREVENIVNDALDKAEFNSSQITGLSGEIEAALTEMIEDCDEDIVRLISQRLSY